MDLLKNIFKGDKVIWIIFLCLCLISIIEVFSAASTLTYKSGDHWGPITQHSIMDDLYGTTVPALGTGKDGCHHCRFVYPVEKAG